MTNVPAALFEPDKSRYNAGATPEIINAVPVADGWAPMPSPTQFTPAVQVLLDENGVPLLDELGNQLVEGIDGSPIVGELYLPSTALGSFRARASDGTVVRFVGTATALYRYNPTTYTYIDVTRTAGGAYSVPVNGRWVYVQYGDIVYAQNGFDTEQQFNIISDTNFSNNSTAPVYSYLAVVQDFLMRAGDTSVQWSALNDPTSNDVGLKFSDIQPFGGGQITGIVPVSTGAVIFLRESIEMMNFNPASEFVFIRSSVTKYRGAIAPYAICPIGQDDFVWYAMDGFFRGTGQQPIGAERVDRWLLANTTEAARVAMVGSADYRRKIVWWRVEVSTGAFVLLGYSWQLDRWCYSTANVVDLFRTETADITIDGADVLFASIDDVDIPFDSSFWDGGSTEFGFIDADGYFGFFNGPPMEATLSTAELAIGGTSRAFINGGRLDGDAANFTVTLQTADYKGGTFTSKPAITPSTRTRFCALRADGRVHKTKVVIPSGEDWTIFAGFDFDAKTTAKS